MINHGLIHYKLDKEETKISNEKEEIDETEATINTSETMVEETTDAKEEGTTETTDATEESLPLEDPLEEEVTDEPDVEAEPEVEVTVIEESLPDLPEPDVKQFTVVTDGVSLTCEGEQLEGNIKNLRRYLKVGSVITITRVI